MTPVQFQEWLVGHGQPIAVDGACGPITRQAIKMVFTNTAAPSVTDAEVGAFAALIGITPKQMAAIAKVECNGSGFTRDGRPTILFERHYFWRLTGGKFGINAYSNPEPGGYSADSWEKLCLAACQDAMAAFSSASWGKFQIMGAHWEALGYASPLAMAYTMTQSEADHYEALVRFIKTMGLERKAAALSTNPEDNRAFAKAYNGSGYARNDYHNKLARAMA
jgi:N-acetylmuramidase-like protein/predicted peptidoglycan binding protein